MSVGPPPRPLTPHNQITIIHLETLVAASPFQSEQVLQSLLALHPEEPDNPKLSSQIERVFNQLLMGVLAMPPSSSPQAAGLPPTSMVLLKEALRVVFRSQQNKAIKRMLVIAFIENVL